MKVFRLKMTRFVAQNRLEDEALEPLVIMGDRNYEGGDRDVSEDELYRQYKDV